jgi:hypothetical protein
MPRLTGTVTTYAGNSDTSASTDGPLTSATFGNPLGLAVDTNGVLFVSDTSKNNIRMITTTGSVSAFSTFKTIYITYFCLKASCIRWLGRHQVEQEMVLEPRPGYTNLKVSP